MFGNSTFTYRSACQAEVALNAQLKLQSRNYKSYWNLEVSARVPRLESNYVLFFKLQPLYFVTSGFWRGLHWDWWKLRRAHFCEVPPPPKKEPLWWPKWHLTIVEDLNIEQWSQHTSKIMYSDIGPSSVVWSHMWPGSRPNAISMNFYSCRSSRMIK